MFYEVYNAPYRLLTSMVWVHPGRDAAIAGQAYAQVQGVRPSATIVMYVVKVITYNRVRLPIILLLIS